MKHLALFAWVGALFVASARGDASHPADLPRYEPRPVAFPRGASYLTPAGAIAIVGYNDMRELLEAVDALFVATHPGFRFALNLPGTRLAPAALAGGTTAFAPMGAEFTASQLQAYRQAVPGPDPVAIRIAHASISPRALSGPLLIVVNPANPLERLTVAEVTRIFTTGDGSDDLTTWGQLGLTETWTNRAIRPIGLAANTALGESMLREKMPGRRFRPGYLGEPQSEDVVRQVAGDPGAIGFAKANVVRPTVKVLAIAERTDGNYSTGSAADLVGGAYAYDRFLYIYIRRAPGAPVDPFVKEYLRLVLSREGQQAVAGTPQAYLPLNPREAAAERAKLDS